MPNIFDEINALKEEIRDRLSRKLSKKEIREAVHDPHAHRRPRPCGLTVHTGIGCPLRCAYCYIYDMGFQHNIRQYPLSPEQLVYALASNPYFIPGRNGTLIAMGSVTEPFLPQTKDLSIKYIEAITKYLGNPIQFSTKMYINKRDAWRIADIDPDISPLITIITIKHRAELEPYAPLPELRFRAIENLSEAGLKPILFYRPIIPGIAEEEYEEILVRAKAAGAIGVVAGGLRVTKNILSRLSEKGVPVKQILRRMTGPLHDNEQVPVMVSDIKMRIKDKALSLGLIFFSQACMANIYTHGMYCLRMVVERTVSARFNLPSSAEIENIVKKAGLTPIRICVTRYTLIISVKEPCDKVRKFLLQELIKYRYKICVSIKCEKT